MSNQQHSLAIGLFPCWGDAAIAMLGLTTKVTRRSEIAQSFGLGCSFWAGQGHGMPTSMRNAHCPDPERMKERW